MELLAIIPARGGSKGIEHKNLQLLAGKPLVLHAVDTAIACNLFDRIIVSSDDEDILACARSRKTIDSTYVRPKHLAQDGSLISDAVLHLLNYLQQTENITPNAFMLLEPTAPLRSIVDLCDAYALFQKNNMPCLISVSTPMQHPSNMIYQHLDSGSHWQHCLARPKTNGGGRQNFTPVWFINGVCYITQTNFFLASQKIFDLQQCTLFKIPSERGVDINTPLDLAYARTWVAQSSRDLRAKLTQHGNCYA